MPGQAGGETGRLLPPSGRATSSKAAASGGVLRWASSGDEGRGAVRSYPVLVPWDILLALALGGPAFVGLLTGWWAAYKDSPWRFGQWEALLVSLLCVLAVLAQSPRRIVREADAFVVEFPLHRRVVSAHEVLELGMVDCTFRLCEILCRWRTFPFGLEPRFFSGFPSSNGAMCVLLTSRCFWSFLFSLEHDVAIQFLVDSQRPLDKGAKYRTTQRVLVREEESFQSRKIGHLKPGVVLRVEEQRGRRVRMSTEMNKLQGWISHINTLGYFLLTKVEDAPAPGVIGASQLATSYGTAVELPTITQGDDEE